MKAIAGWLADPEGLTPHGFCLLWQPGLLWTHAAADLVVALAYFSIPIALAVFVQRRRDLAFRPVLQAFAAFILLCGTGHLIEVLTLWVPAYWLAAVVKVLTALASVATAILLWRLIPEALAWPSPQQLREANRALADLADERGRIAERLRQSETRLWRNFVRSPMCLHELDSAGRITGVSDGWLELVGGTGSAVIGRPFADLFAPGELDGFAADWERVTTEGEVRDAERRLIRLDGDVLDVLVSARREQIDGSDDFRVLGALVDVTARRRAENALRVSEERLHRVRRMEALGQLTGGVAHDFNNVLQAIVGVLELIRNRTRVTVPDAAQLAGRALEASDRAAKLVGQLLTYARRQRLEPLPLDSAAVIEDMRALLLGTLGPAITLTVTADPAAPPCLADRAQLESALLNLVINARDAIESRATTPGRGEVVIDIGREELSDGEILAEMPLSGTFLRIAVSDDGGGMTEDIRRRAFEPFFTTKPIGEGTGLGLAQIHGFAHQSGGTVTLVSAPGAGTTVTILLPVADSAVATPRAVTTASPATTRVAGPRALVLDGDRMVRGAVSDLLTDRGFVVDQAADTVEALGLLDRGPHPVALLADVAVPPEAVTAFIEAVRIRCPGLPVVLMSSDPALFGGHNPLDQVAYLAKPFEEEGLIAVLNHLLAPHRARVVAAAGATNSD